MSGNNKRIHHIAKGDTRTPIGATLKQGGSAINGVGLTLQTKMVGTRVDGSAYSRDWTATNASWNDAANGKAQYTFTADDVAYAGTFFLWFRVVTGGSLTDVFPCDGRQLQISIHDPS